ncbi:telomere repeat-binding protein 5 isoform X2 [Daucus carota subsp. sativus]|uniref:telomere repeat-binding protein 5 isoform X2 n=1 Tax=Daucus carota subsp. sativus TaxID=79200 RepID=UPI0030834813
MLHKRLNHGLYGYEVPPIPRAARSARRRVPYRKKSDDDQMCAFDLLATVAGKLLEGENSPSAAELLNGVDKSAVGADSLKKEKVVKDNPEKLIPCIEEKRGRNFFVSEIISQAPKHTIKEVSHAQNDACSAFASVITTSDGSDMFGTAAKLVDDQSKNGRRNFSKLDMERCGSTISFSRLDDENKNCIKIEPAMTGKEPCNARADTCCIKDLTVQDLEPHALGNADNRCKFPVKPSVLDEGLKKGICRDQGPRGSFPTCKDNVKLVVRDGDENSSWCTTPRKLNKAFRPPARMGDRRIKRLLASRYWKAPPKLSNEDCFNIGLETKPVYQNKANGYKRQRSLRDYPIKKRRLYGHSFETNAYEMVNNNDTSFSPGKGYSENASGSVPTMHEAKGVSTFATSQQNCFQPRDSHVKLKIKSFRVPELFFEIPETATVGSLKRTVMEAVNSVLGGGLRVGVLFQGKKIRDDNKTLVQTGIYDNNKNDSLGFTLEPLCSQVSPTQYPEDHALTPARQITRCPHTGLIVKQGNSDVPPDLPSTNFSNIIESDHDSAPSPPDVSIDKCLADSKALVATPEMNVEPLSAISMRKSKRLDVGQRRIRRPFSVSEVEALVQAVEKLGTGRTSGKRWYIQQEYLPSREEENPCLRNS